MVLIIIIIIIVIVIIRCMSVGVVIKLAGAKQGILIRLLVSTADSLL